MTHFLGKCIKWGRREQQKASPLKKKIFYSLKILGVHFLALLNQTLNKTIALLTGQRREKDTGWIGTMETGRRAEEKGEAGGTGGGRGDSKMNPKKQRQKPIKRAWKRKTMF